MAQRSRVKVYDAENVARDISKTFKDRPVEYVEEHKNWSWPPVIQEFAESLGTAYESDKWKEKRADGTRPRELYKHISEYPVHRVYAEPGLLRLVSDVKMPIDMAGRKISLTKAAETGEIVMPDSFAVLAEFTELDVVLNRARGNKKGKRPEDDGVVALMVSNGMLGASHMLVHGKKKPFLFVYSNNFGVYFIITGDKLDIEKDGIVG